MLRTVLTLGSIISTGLAAPNADAFAACKTLDDRYSDQVATTGVDFPLGLAYTQARTSYWSLANADVKPACIFFPKTAQDIQFAVQTLNKYNTAPWAIKGAGHNPNVGFSSTKDGVLIATHEFMATTTLDSNNLAHVGPGNRWIDVAKALQPSNRAVVSGRLGVVGVPGLTMGGGLSFLSTQYGMTADNVVEFEVVTAQGELTRANRNQNSDLFYAMKGGGGQFAIVTEFVMQTYPIGKVWGGHKIFPMSQKDALLKATHNLNSNYNDTKAAVIVTYSSTLDTLVDIFVVFMFYDGPQPGTILDEFNAIPSLIDQTKPNRDYAELLDSNSFFSLQGQRYLIRTGTLPNLPGAQGVDLYNFAFTSFFDGAKKAQLLEIDNYIFSMAFQPIPHQLASNSVNNPSGVNLIGLDPRYGDKVFLEYDVSWLLPITDQKAAATITNLTQAAQDYGRSKYANVRPTNYQSGDLGWGYRPLFMNDAMFNQDPLKSYPAESYARLQQIQRQRDPNGFFSKRTGGFKV
ncbi:Bifunctional solanapyrone synthase [Cercospora beticola]|uniref:Bifunctional solanapyrone synthase n=1 Tax=Cercospora beticola TaxID=122368 RepID=A0A2G5HUE8_CERBT|nr:Bifunctional solanapyrone synthase [Cercospora beticola]PIA96174.1 Bifunctional solanapyrone synthase [Cercospora beticola]WPB07394.1 hypothetical protein RHO25_012055 [Cercospora beticola]